MDIEGVIIFDSKSGIPLFSRLRKGIDALLFSSFISAIGHFSRELKLGGLSSFTTEEKQIILAAKENTITALITPTTKVFQEARSLAMEMGRQFETLHERQNSLQAKDYTEFQVVADEFIRKIKNPFLSRVADFIHKQYGGSVSLKQRLIKESGAEVTVDMLVNFGIKYEEDDDSVKPSKQTPAAYSESNIVCKINEGRISRGEIMEFLDTLDGFGVRVISKGAMQFMPYFPTRAAIIAREFDDSVFEYLRKLPTEDNQAYLDGSHIFAGRGIRGAPKNPKCFIDVFQYHENDKSHAVKF
ncbi:MAG: hypothetical protein P1Q69_15920 [Candidatus Thorarchaeota archaeon]|nr:hypothetical protein [Candidatus Thorarchaeota archaeon]